MERWLYDTIQKRMGIQSQIARSEKQGLTNGERKMRRLVLDDFSKRNGSAGVEQCWENDLDVCLRSAVNSEEGKVTFTPLSAE